MRTSAAKALIVNAYSNIIGFEMSQKMEVPSYLSIGVKCGRLTAEAAAESMIKTQTEMCTAEADKFDKPVK